jgi:hypothetical protein
VQLNRKSFTLSAAITVRGGMTSFTEKTRH